MIDLAGRYCARALSSDGILWSWNTDPLVLMLLGMSAFAAARLSGVRRSAGLASVGVLALAFISPLCPLSASLFSARAVHHLLIVGAAAPLLAAALPMGRRLSPLPTLLLSSGLLWSWHLPAAYDRALVDPPLYWAMQASLLGSATCYWVALRGATVPVAGALVIGGMVQMGLLGAILSFAPQPLYEGHLATTVRYGLGPLADQQLGGLLMWTAGMIPYALAGWLIARSGWHDLAREPAT